MNTIVTFYSYKGGVGRSMALANVAVLLARRGLRVLMVDWDLEAPGIENYFTAFELEAERPGLLKMLIDSISKPDLDYNKYIWRVQDDGNSLSLLSSGKATDDRYSANLERFDWELFFEKGGGEFLESLREVWGTAYDITLIDSRTGLSDSGGICTIQLPDVVVAMFTANHQSLYGVRDVMRLAQEARHSLAYDREQLSIVPLASRFGNDFRESKEWLDRTSEAMSEFYRDWLPSWANPREIVEQLKIPHVDYFGYGEKLAVVEQGTSDPQGMGFAYNKVANLLANNLRDAEKIFEMKQISQAKTPPSQKGKRASSKASTLVYEYDLYVSYHHSELVEEWLRPFVSRLEQYVSELQGKVIKTFLDYSVLQAGASWPIELERALLRSKLLLAIITPRYFNSTHAMAEWRTFERREKRAGANSQLIIPVVLTGLSSAPEWFKTRQYFDMSTTFQRRKLTSRMEEAISKLADVVNRALLTVPPISDVPVVEPIELGDPLYDPFMVPFKP